MTKLPPVVVSLVLPFVCIIVYFNFASRFTQWCRKRQLDGEVPGTAELQTAGGDGTAGVTWRLGHDGPIQRENPSELDHAHRQPTPTSRPYPYNKSPAFWRSGLCRAA